MTEFKKISLVFIIFLISSIATFVYIKYFDESEQSSANSNQTDVIPNKTKTKLTFATAAKESVNLNISKNDKTHKENSVTSPHCLVSCPNGKPNNKLIRRSIYILSNNKNTKFADWVAYVVTPDTIGKSKRRVWRSDPKLEENETLEPNDYRGANRELKTDRGHQVPLASFAATPDWSQTNYLSNITPQSSNLNQGCWVRLESKVRKLARQYKSVFVMSGPLYIKKMQSLPGADEAHSVPSAYWKIVTVKTSNAANPYRHTAFIFPQSAARRDSYCKYRSSIANIEKVSGFTIAKLKSQANLLCE